MSLSLSLNTAISGLRVNRESLAVLSQNIANANNPNYSRKIISQTTVTLDGVGAGVSIEDITRKIDSYLQLAVREQTGVSARAGVLNDYAERLQILLGSPGAGNGMNAHITNMFNALQSLAETPESSSNRVNVLNAANHLANEMNQLFEGIQQLRFEADQDIKVSTTTVNLRLRELYGLNAAISNAQAMNRPVSELLDQRDAAIRDISEHIDINIYVRTDETVHVYARGGSALIDQNLYELDYRPATSPNAFLVEDPQMSPLRVFMLDGQGNRVSESISLISGGSSDEITTGMQNGAIRGFIDMRDDKLPQLMDQIDMLSARLRDEINAIHNEGSGFPGSAKLTGTRPITAGTTLNWEGKVRIGLLDVNGLPIASMYGDEDSPMRALDIDLSTLDAGQGDGPGYPDMQSIVNEINFYYGIPRNRVTLGNLNNIELTSTTSKLPGSYFDFNFELENISGAGSEFFVTSMSVVDENGLAMTPVTSTIPSVSLNALNTYTTVDQSSTVTIAATAHGLQEGDYVFLPTPSSDVGGISSAALGGMFQITNVTANGFDITTSGVANANATLGEAGTAYSSYHEMASGGRERTTNGGFRADLGGNLNSDFYDIQAQVAAIDDEGNVTYSTISYRVNSGDSNMFNKRYGALSATNNGEIERPSQLTQPLARAKLVDANGQEIGKVNNRYYSEQEAYLQIEVNNRSYYISIDSLDSMENGNPSGSPFVVPGTQRGFSHFFELNNFFESNHPTSTGDTVENSARNLRVSDHIRNNPSNISTGRLVLSPQSADPDAAPIYSYERISGDDSLAQRLASLANSLVTFDQAGGLSSTNNTLSGYAGEILGFAGSDANSMQSNYRSSQTILQGFQERSYAISGVNLDEELANTIIYQNAYTASARVITTTNELFETLLSAFG